MSWQRNFLFTKNNAVVIYCKANLLDLVLLEKLEKDCFPTNAFNRRLIKSLLINPKSVIIKAVTPSGKTVGDIIGVIKKENSIPVGRIFSLCVIEAYRKKGIATHLLKMMEEEFCLRGIKKIRLEVSTRNSVARLFYKRHGYLTTSSILSKFYNDGTDAIVMRKNFL